MIFFALDCKIVVIQLIVFAAMTVFNKPLMKRNEMKWNETWNIGKILEIGTAFFELTEFFSLPFSN